MKKCKKCLKDKILHEFGSNSHMADGKLNTCKDCSNKYSQDDLDKIECIRCGRALDVIRRRGGIPSYCADCARKLDNICKENYRKNNPEKVAETKKKSRNPDLQRANTAKRRALESVLIQEVDRVLVFDVYNGCCYLCGWELNPEDWHLDHIQALSRGGAHCYANVAPSCPPCNLSKWNRDLIVFVKNF